MRGATAAALDLGEHGVDVTRGIVVPRNRADNGELLANVA